MSNESTTNKLQEIWRELNILETVYRSRKICSYRPLPTGEHESAHKALAEAFVILIFGSNRSGKSVFGVVESVAHSLGYRPWLPEDHPDRIVRLANGEPIPVPNVGRVIAQNYQQAIQQNIWPLFQEWAPSGWYTFRKDNRGIPVEIIWKNGSRIYLMSNDQDDMAFEGTKGHWAWADEPIDYRKYIALRRGLIDYSGHMWLTQTPLTHPWTWEILGSKGNVPRSGIRLFHFDIWANWTGRGGTLSKENIIAFINDLRPDEKEARLHGRPLWMAGRVYPEWEAKEPFWIEPIKLKESWPRVCIIDPHPRKPIAVLWAAITPDNQILVYRELFDIKLRTVADVATKIKQLEGWYFDKRLQKYLPTTTSEPVMARLIDPQANQNEPTSGDTIFKRFAMEDIWCLPAKKHNAEAGYDAIHQALKVDGDWQTPGLIVFNTCTTVKNNFQLFCWDEWATEKQRDLKGDKQEVRKTHDDFIDCIRYIYQSGITYNVLIHQMRHNDQRVDFHDDDYNGIGMISGLQGPMTRRKRQECQTYSGHKHSHASNLRGTELHSTISRMNQKKIHSRNLRRTE